MFADVRSHRAAAMAPDIRSDCRASPALARLRGGKPGQPPLWNRTSAGPGSSAAWWRCFIAQLAVSSLPLPLALIDIALNVWLLGAFMFLWALAWAAPFPPSSAQRC
jgi:hypothetical protein